MTNSENIVKQILQAFNDHDLEKVSQMLHPQFTYTGSDGTRIEGIQSTIEVDAMYLKAFPDMRMETMNTYHAGDTVVAEILVQGTQKGKFMDIEPTNRKVNYPVCAVYEIRDNKLYSSREYFDTNTLLKQLAVQPRQQAAHA